jgi:hypothetical protein
MTPHDQLTSPCAADPGIVFFLLVEIAVGGVEPTASNFRTDVIFEKGLNFNFLIQFTPSKFFSAPTSQRLQT